jgi:hypothetical protein
VLDHREKKDQQATGLTLADRLAANIRRLFSLH